jgi:cytochrome P450
MLAGGMAVAPPKIEDLRGSGRSPELPPRPDLSRLMMSVGFILKPTEFLDACHERVGDYFTLRPAPGREIVVTADPAAVKQVFTGDHA